MRFKINHKLLIPAGILFLGCFMRVYGISSSSLWTDELATYWISSAPTISECAARAMPTQGQSPFYFVMVWTVLRILAPSEFALRLISLAASVFSIWLCFQVTALTFRNWNILFSRTKKSAGIPEKDIFTAASFASLLYAVNSTSIYYAQEARPYALAMMFALLSQIFFIRMLRRSSFINTAAYILFSALICFTHYVFAVLLITQNIWMLLLLIRSWRTSLSATSGVNEKQGAAGGILPSAGDISLRRWCIVQLVLIALLLPLALHLEPILSEGGKWNWLEKGSLSVALQLFGGIVQPGMLLFSASLFLFLLTYRNLPFSRGAEKNMRKTESAGGTASGSAGPVCSCAGSAFSADDFRFLLFTGIWIFMPVLFVWLVSRFGDTSIMAGRYLTSVLIPLFIVAGRAAIMIRGTVPRSVFAALTLFIYAVRSLVPVYASEGRFTHRIPHDWRDALNYIQTHAETGDALILRSGMVREDWLPETDSRIITEYVKAPIYSFYMRNNPGLKVMNLTFTPSLKFRHYYDTLCSEASVSPEIWILGVSAPNSFPIRNIPAMFADTHNLVQENNFSGVYLALLRREIPEEQ